MNEIFGPLATLNASDTEWQKAFEALKSGGIFGLLEQDDELIRALAMIGLVNTFSTEIGVVRMMSRVLDVDEGAVERVMSLSSRCGLRLVAKKGESVMALV